MANEKRLIDANDVKELINGLSELPWEEEVDYLVDSLPTVDAVEVCYCDNCVNHGNCLPEDIFRMARIEKPYCCAGKVDGDRNA